MTAIPRSEIQTLCPGALVPLFELDATSIGGDLTCWCPFVNRLGNPVVFQGVTYLPFPIKDSGFEHSTDGALPTPTIQVAGRCERKPAISSSCLGEPSATSKIRGCRAANSDCRCATSSAVGGEEISGHERPQMRSPGYR